MKHTHTDVYFIVKTRDKEWDSRDVCEHILVSREEAYQIAGFVGYSLGRTYELAFAIETKSDNALDDLRVEIFFMKPLEDFMFKRITSEVPQLVLTYLFATA